jgi:DNA polymerase III subunit epsilon
MLDRLLDSFLSLAVRRRWQYRQCQQRAPDSPLARFLAAPLPDNNADWREVRYLALDLETTGGDPAKDDILSFGWLCLDGDQIALASARHRLVQPRRALNEASVTIHRITDDRAAEGEALAAVLADFLQDMAGRVLIAHYSPTEVGFIDAACRACFGGRFLVPVIDTLVLARQAQANPQPGALRLGALRKRHHLPRYPAHHALSDALSAAELFLAQANEKSRDRPAQLGSLLLKN